MNMITSFSPYCRI